MTPLRIGRGRGYPAAITEPRPKIDPQIARAAWSALQQAGGLVSAVELRERWGTPEQPLSKGRVHEYTRMPDFPNPVEESRGATRWLAAEVDAWMAERITRQGRRGPQPRHVGPPQTDNGA